MADMKFTADISDLKELSRLLKSELPKSTRQFATGAVSSFLKVSEATRKASSEAESYRALQQGLKQNATMVAQANQAHVNSLLSVSKANKSARDSANTFTLALRKQEAIEKQLALASDKKVQAEARNTAELKRVRMSVDAVYGAQQRRLHLKKLLRNAIASETMTTQEAIVELKRYNAEQMSSNSAMGNSRNRMNGMNMAVQQMGYQFGDFAVQVQGGTSAFVAFSQQGAQLAGILPSIAGPLGLSLKSAVALSAGLGVLIPIGSALGRMFFEMKGKAKEAADAADTYEKSVKAAKEATKGLRQEVVLLNSGFKTMAEMALNTAVDKAESALAALVALQASSNSASARSMRNAPSGRQNLAQNDDAIVTAREILRLAQEELKVHNDSSDALKKNSRLEEMTAFFKEAQVRILSGLRKKNGQQMQETLDLEKEVSKAARNTNAEKTRTNDITQKFLSDIIKVYELEKDIRKELGEAAFNALKLSDVDIESGVSAAAKSAAILAAKLGIAFSSAQDIQLMQLSGRNANEVYSGRGSVGMPSETNRSGEFKPSKDLIKEADILLGLRKPDKDKKSSSKKTVDEYLEELRKEQAHKSSLVGLSKEAIKQSEFEFKLRKKISTLEGETSEAKVIAVLREQEALEKAAEKQKERMQQEQTYSSILASSLESVVQGTLSVEDAFKSMLSNIIMEIYKTNIAEPFADKGASFITSLISSAFGGGPQVGAPTSSLRPQGRPFADGGAFTKINAYATGGVVSSPTTFPMSGGQTGLMGEAGAEAIMPLKRGRNGKLGVQAEGSSGDVININQSFNFQSNGDDTIKSLIAQAAPKIAQMTKASMLDDRRRGGRTKAAFG